MPPKKGKILVSGSVKGDSESASPLKAAITKTLFLSVCPLSLLTISVGNYAHSWNKHQTTLNKP